MSIQDDFLAFHQANPMVWKLFERFALEAARTGRRFGAKLVWERMRWEVFLETDEEARGGYRLNNNYTAHYARLFQDVHRAHAELIETRKLRAADPLEL